MDDLLHPDRRQQQRRRNLEPEHGGAQVAFADVAQHPRHDPLAPQRVAIGAHRVLAAGAGADVGGGLGVHRLDRALLELGDRDRELRLLAAETAGVDLAVVVGIVGHAGSLLPPRRGRLE
jgi:hypothetical protein